MKMSAAEDSRGATRGITYIRCRPANVCIQQAILFAEERDDFLLLAPSNPNSDEHHMEREYGAEFTRFPRTELDTTLSRRFRIRVSKEDAALPCAL
jgi:hypothetical protein